MRPEDLWQQYPVLYHIAWGGSWPSIKEHGLLSTKALLRSYGKSEDHIVALTQGAATALGGDRLSGSATGSAPGPEAPDRCGAQKGTP